MKINAASKVLGLSQDTLRWYEKEGVIPPVKRGPDGQRDYTEETLDWIRLAMLLRDAGLPIKAIREYQQLSAQGDSTIEGRLKLLEREEAVMKKRQEDLEKGLAKIHQMIQIYREGLKTGHLDWGPGKTEF